MKYKHQEGFTLLELLVAMTILSLVSILLFNGIQIALDNSNQLSKKLKDTEIFEALDRSFRREMTSMIPITIYENKKEKVYFFGKKHSIEYLHPGKNGPERHTIKANVKGNISFTVGVLKTVSKEFKTSIHSFKFYGKTFNEKETRWHEEWLNQPNTPLLVQLLIANHIPITVRLPRNSQWR